MRKRKPIYVSPRFLRALGACRRGVYLWEKALGKRPRALNTKNLLRYLRCRAHFWTGFGVEAGDISWLASQLFGVSTICHYEHKHTVEAFLRVYAKWLKRQHFTGYIFRRSSVFHHN